MKLHVVLAIFFISSCASLSQRRERAEIIDLYKSQGYKTLVKRIKEKKILDEKRDRFLRSVELGSAFFRMGQYSSALDSFKMARAIADQLYTVRLSKKIESYLLTDSNDIYYPNPLELTQLRMFEVISHLKLYEQSTPDKKGVHRNGLESTMRDWHSFLENKNEMKLGKAVFKGTVLADIMSLIVHQYLGSSSDLSVAKSFKGIAKKNLYKKMGLYRSFNHNHELYKKDFADLHKKSKKEIFDKYIDKTKAYEDVEKFLNDDYSQVVLVLKNIITPKTANKVVFPLNILAYASIPAANEGDFVSFATTMLSIAAGANPTISFELPEVKFQSRPVNTKYEILSEGTLKEVSESIMIANNSEVLGQLLSEESAAIKTKTGTKLAIKHIAMLVTAYQSYRLLRSKQGEFLAYAAATASYTVANKSLEQFERADLRMWLGMFDEIEIVPLKLSPGNYKIKLDGKLVDFKITNEKKQIIPLIL